MDELSQKVGLLLTDCALQSRSLWHLLHEDCALTGYDFARATCSSPCLAPQPECFTGRPR